jgi:hypothetical protein
MLKYNIVRMLVESALFQWLDEHCIVILYFDRSIIILNEVQKVQKTGT